MTTRQSIDERFMPNKTPQYTMHVDYPSIELHPSLMGDGESLIPYMGYPLPTEQVNNLFTL